MKTQGRGLHRLPGLLAVILVGAMLLGVSAVDTLAQSSSGDFDAEAYWAGRTVTIIVPWREGSGTDLMARTLAPFLTKYTPGRPRFVVENRPGADGAAGMNYFDQAADPDGYTILFSPVINLNQAFSHLTGARYDARRWHILGSLGETGVTYASTSRLRSAADLLNLKDPLFVALRGISTPPTWDAVTAFDALGVNIRGLEYPGGAGDARAAVFRGEADVFNESAAGFVVAVMPEVDNGNVIPLWQGGLLVDGKLVRDERAKDVPTFAELYEELTGKPLGEPHLSVFKMIASAHATERMAALPPGTPEPIAAALSEAWYQATSDPEWQQGFLANGVPLMVGNAATAREAMLATLDIPDDIMKLLETWYQQAID